MPLSELYRMARGKSDSSQDKNPSSSTDLSFVPENDFDELVWENGQISMQGQSSRARKIPAFKTRDKDVGNGENNTKMGKFGLIDMEMDSVLSEITTSVVPSHGDEMVPWMKYTEPEDQCLQNECSDLLPELSGLAANEIPSHSSLTSFNRIGRSVRNDVAGLEQRKPLKVPKPADEEARPRSSRSNQPSQICQVSNPYFRTRNFESIGNNSSHAFTDRAICSDSAGVQPSVDALPCMKMQKQDPVAPCNNTALMNFSHFSRPAALVKASLQNIGTIARIDSKEKGFVVSTRDPVESTLINSDIELHKEKMSHCHSTIVPMKTDIKESEAKSLDKPVSAEPDDAIYEENVPKGDKTSSQVINENTTKLPPHSDKAVGSVLAASSIFCGNRVERGSDDPLHDLKRKNHDDEEYEYPSDDAEEESVGVKKSVPARGGKGSKRSRAAEVHNLSERRRRDRINEKMRALQELIPNCNKVDKASMLDEAIEYLKTLQLQVQIMSMRTGLYMPPMMFPTGMQHMHAAHMAHFASMGVGMGMGFGMPFPEMNAGASAFPMVQVPPIPGAPFSGPGPHMSGPTTLHDMTRSNLQLHGLHGQGHPMSMPGAPLMPIPGGHVMKTAIGSSDCGLVRPTENIDSATASGSKDPIQNIESQVVQNTNINSSGNRTSNQVRKIFLFKSFLLLKGFELPLGVGWLEALFLLIDKRKSNFTWYRCIPSMTSNCDNDLQVDKFRVNRLNKSLVLSSTTKPYAS